MDSSRYAPRRSTLPRFAPGGFKILLEVLVRTPRLQVAEVPFEFAERHAGKSKASAREMARYLRQLVVLRIATADRPGLARS
jgi:dolichol-phosphate mannosyltransferase